MLRRVAEVVAAWCLQWLPIEAASFANFPWGGGSSSDANTEAAPDPDPAQPGGKRRRGRRLRSVGADEPPT